jgi:hypothetical protein
MALIVVYAGPIEPWSSNVACAMRRLVSSICSARRFN